MISSKKLTREGKEKTSVKSVANDKEHFPKNNLRKIVQNVVLRIVECLSRPLASID